MKHVVRQYGLEQGALEIQYIEENFSEFRNKKTAEEIMARLSDRECLILLSMAKDNLAAIWCKMVETGVVPAGQNAFDILRIEAAMPLFGIDFSDDNLAQEVARTAAAISFKKGCYLGQEPIARLDALGHVNRQLCTIEFTTGRSPAAGETVVSTADVVLMVMSTLAMRSAP